MKQVIKIYTDDKAIYKLVNNMLRSCIDILEMFYVQVYVQDLHKAIRMWYSTNKDKL